VESGAGKPNREKEQRQMAYAVGGLLVLVLGIYGYPALVLGAFIGGLLAAIMPPRAAEARTRARRRQLAWWQVGSGAGLLVAYLAFRVPLALATQSRRFLSAWHSGVQVHPSALVEYPWGWAPLAIAIGLIAAGAITRWRAR
jgi:hypothetical protein